MTKKMLAMGVADLPASFGLCGGAAGGLGLSGEGNLCIVRTGDGHVSLTLTPGGGLGGIGGNLLVGPTFGDAQNVNDLKGWFTYTGASGSVGPIGASAEYAWGTNGEGRTIHTFTPQWAPGAQLPFTSGGRSYTFGVTLW